MIDWLWLWLAGLQQKRAERRVAAEECAANVLLVSEDADLARDLGILPVIPIAVRVVPSQEACDLLRLLNEPGAPPPAQALLQNQYAAAMGGLLGGITGGPVGAAYGRQIAGMIGGLK